jgi:hypothetical protein
VRRGNGEQGQGHYGDAEEGELDASHGGPPVLVKLPAN